MRKNSVSEKDREINVNINCIERDLQIQTGRETDRPTEMEGKRGYQAVCIEVNRARIEVD